jgi:hypothetical protein
MVRGMAYPVWNPTIGRYKEGRKGKRRRIIRIIKK